MKLLAVTAGIILGFTVARLIWRAADAAIERYRDKTFRSGF